MSRIAEEVAYTMHRQTHAFVPKILISPEPVQIERKSAYRRIREMIAAFAGKRILVLGDMIADEYLVGTATRLSREAPIPIISQHDHYIVPGGAMNPAVNARTLGAEVYVAGIIGDDAAGSELRTQLRDLGIDHTMLITEPNRPTSSKLRILASNNQGIVQHVARIDNIDTTPISTTTASRIMRALEHIIPEVDGVILSDYDNGLMGLPLIDTAMSLARRHRRVIVADAHGGLERFQSVTAITPNEPEAEIATGMRIHDMDSLEQAGNRLSAMTGAQGVLITRGSEGMVLFEHGNEPVHIPVCPVEARDTTGAGDTVAATFTLALTTGASMSEAATLANVAAALVVQRMGCATNTPEELLHAALRAEF
jgi:D-glycero-beta-D-manno-heptose-7-phosphate kinase